MSSLSGGMNGSLSGGMNSSLSGGMNSSLSGGMNESLSGGMNSSLSGGMNSSLSDGMNDSLGDEDASTQRDFPRKRCRKPDLSKWTLNINKRLRTSGKEYLGRKLDKENGTWNLVMRPERKRGSLCRKELCKKRSRQCNEFTELDCEIIFQEYWKSADIKKQETFIQSLVDLKAKATSTVSEQSRRQHTKCY